MEFFNGFLGLFLMVFGKASIAITVAQCITLKQLS